MTIINTFGARSLLLARFGYILIGAIIGQYLFLKYQAKDNGRDGDGEK